MYFDWLRAHLDMGNKNLWISFHTRNTQWINPTAANATFVVDVQLQSGATPVDALQITADTVSATSAELTYVVFRDQGTAAVMHFHCGSGGKACVVESVAFSGDPVHVTTRSTAAAALPLTIPAGGHVIIMHALSDAISVGDVWTVVVNGRDGYGGRAVVERFSIES